MMIPVVYILCGIQFSGKSTLARCLAEKCGWVHVSVDDLAESLLASIDSEVSEDQWSEAFRASCALVAASLARGRSVVYDATNYERVTRDQIRELARQHGAAARVIYLAIPVEEANRRRIANQVHPQRHDVADAGFWEMVSSLEAPTADELPLIFDGTQAIDEWIERFL